MGKEIELFVDESAKTMTVKQVAEALGYQPDTIQKTAKALEMEGKIARISIRADSSHALLLDEAQVQAVKDALVPRTLALKSKVESAQTALDIAEMTLKVIEYHKGEADRLRAELALTAPKVEFFDQIIDSRDAIPMRNAAAVLNIPGYGRNNLFAKLRELKILDSSNLPYREYQDRGYFRVVEDQWSDSQGGVHVTSKTLVYQKGLDYIRSKIKAN